MGFCSGCRANYWQRLWFVVIFRFRNESLEKGVKLKYYYSFQSWPAKHGLGNSNLRAKFILLITSRKWSQNPRGSPRKIPLPVNLTLRTTMIAMKIYLTRSRTYLPNSCRCRFIIECQKYVFRFSPGPIVLVVPLSSFISVISFRAFVTTCTEGSKPISSFRSLTKSCRDSYSGIPSRPSKVLKDKTRNLLKT